MGGTEKRTGNPRVAFRRLRGECQYDSEPGVR
jgi:hypothetical protein